MAITNEYGIVMKEIRKRRGITLNDMANAMDVSISFLSALEVGNKTIPQNYPDKVASYYDLSLEELKELKNAMDLSNGKIIIPINKLDEEKTDILLEFARKIENPSLELLLELKLVLKMID